MHDSHMALVADKDAFRLHRCLACVARLDGTPAWESVGCRRASAPAWRHVGHVFPTHMSTEPPLIGPPYLARPVKPCTYLIDGF